MLILSILVITIHNNNAQVKVDNTGDILILTEEEENAVITEIRRKYRLIDDNYLDNYLNISKDLMGYSAEGGKIRAYYDDSVLRKGTVSYFGETGQKIVDYYFWDNEIFFIFVQDYYFNSPVYVTEDIPEEGVETYDEKKTEESVNRYYFTKNKLIRWIKPDKKKVDIKSPAFKEKQEELLKDVQFIKDKLIQ